MKPPKKPSVSYFPVHQSEHDLLLRVREADLENRGPDVLDMLDQLATAKTTPADLALALQLLQESRQGEGLIARFENLEARVKDRLERGLAEIEGRMSRSRAVDVTTAPMTEAATPVPPPRVVVPVVVSEVPKEASLAIRIGTDLVWGESAAEFYVAVWRWLFEHGRVKLADLPIAAKKRYVAATEPIHPTGKEFYNAREPVPGVFIDVNMSRANILTQTRKYLAQHGVTYELVVGEAI